MWLFQASWTSPSGITSTSRRLFLGLKKQNQIIWPRVYNTSCFPPQNDLVANSRDSQAKFWKSPCKTRLPPVLLCEDSHRGSQNAIHAEPEAQSCSLFGGESKPNSFKMKHLGLFQSLYRLLFKSHSTVQLSSKSIILPKVGRSLEDVCFILGLPYNLAGCRSPRRFNFFWCHLSLKPKGASNARCLSVAPLWCQRSSHWTAIIS